MSKPDFVSEVLTYLTDGGGAQENWDTNNYSPAPILYNGRDGVRQDTSERVKRVDLTENAVITVDGEPTGTNRPLGTEYDHRYRFGAGVRIEGAHTDIGGNITDDDDFDSLVTEALRAILAERQFPTTAVYHLEIVEESDNSESPERADSRSQQLNLFDYTFDVWFEGFESLP